MRKKHLRSILALVGLVGMIGVCGCTHRSQYCARWESHNTEIPPLIEQQTVKQGWGSGTHNLERKQPDSGPVLNENPAAEGDQSADEAENWNVGTPARTEFQFESETPGEGQIDNAPSTNSDDKSLENPPDAVATLEKLGALIEFDEDGNVLGADLSQTQITEAELWSLAGLTEIKELNLSDTQLTDAGLEHLKGLTRLRLLWLNGTQVSDAGLLRLKNLTELELLGLTKTRITDAGLEHLKGLTKLKYLLLGRTRITDVGLEHLKELTNLEGLSLIRAKVTDEGVDMLQQSLPSCRIIADPFLRQSKPRKTLFPNQPNQPEPLEKKSESLNPFQGISDEHVKSAVGDFRPGIRQGQSTNPATEAQRRLMSLLGLKLSDPHFLEAVGQFFASQGRWNEAVEILELAVLVSPDETILRYHLAAALAHSGNVEAAMPHFQQSVGDAAAHYNIGVILCQNALQASREKFLEALEKNPDLKEAELWLDEVSGTRIP
jgi:tetratricopeptide (TPR) repeat protein